MYYNEPWINPLLPLPHGMIKTVVNFKQCRSLNHAPLSLIFFPWVMEIGMVPGEPEALWRLVSGKIMKGRFLDSPWKKYIWIVGECKQGIENRFLFKGPVSVSSQQPCLTKDGWQNYFRKCYKTESPNFVSDLLNKNVQGKNIFIKKIQSSSDGSPLHPD